MESEPSPVTPKLVEVSLPALRVALSVIDSVKVGDCTPIDLQNLAYVKNELALVIEKAEKEEQTAKDLEVLEDVIEEAERPKAKRASRARKATS